MKYHYVIPIKVNNFGTSTCSLMWLGTVPKGFTFVSWANHQMNKVWELNI